MYVMVETFWRYFDKTGRIWSELNRNSYGVYIIHVIVIGVIALPLLNSAMPSLLKYLISDGIRLCSQQLDRFALSTGSDGMKVASQRKSPAQPQ